eukprot:EG_transcript_13388
MALSAVADEVVLLVLQFLDSRSLARCEAVCRRLQALCAAAHLWEALCDQYAWLGRPRPPSVAPKAYYRRLRRPDGAAFVVMGGHYNSRGRQWGLGTWEWEDTPAMEDMRVCAALAVDGEGGLVAMGGMSYEGTMESVERLDPACQQWRPLPPMALARCCAGAAALGRDHLAAVGGGESMWMSSRVWDSCELFDCTVAQWRSLPPLLAPRCALGLAWVGNVGRLYAVGGYEGQGSYLATVECFDPGAGGQWLWGPPLPQPSVGNVTATGPDWALYVAGGGHDGNRDSQQPTLLRLDPRCPPHWHRLRPMAEGRFYFAGGFGPDGWLYVAGGYTHDGQLRTAERYDPRADRWERLPDFGAPLNFCTGAVLV